MICGDETDRRCFVAGVVVSVESRRSTGEEQCPGDDDDGDSDRAVAERFNGQGIDSFQLRERYVRRNIPAPKRYLAAAAYHSA